MGLQSRNIHQQTRFVGFVGQWVAVYPRDLFPSKRARFQVGNGLPGATSICDKVTQFSPCHRAHRPRFSTLSCFETWRQRRSRRKKRSRSRFAESQKKWTGHEIFNVKTEPDFGSFWLTFVPQGFSQSFDTSRRKQGTRVSPGQSC